MPKSLLALMLAMLTITTAFAGAEEKAAQASAESFLKLIDAEDYSKAYQNCSALLKEKASESDFAGPIKGARAKLGKVTARKFKSATPMNDPQGQKGRFVVVEFRTDFANQKGLVERVTPMEEKGAWKVAGYYIVPDR
ncbi:MAG: DUF4019 domain-containing protein [Candidatus Eremiobacterota bacterium]